MPYLDTVIVALSSADYFGDDVSVSQPLTVSNNVNGKINFASDVDVFAYTAVKDALHIF